MLGSLMILSFPWKAVLLIYGQPYWAENYFAASFDIIVKLLVMLLFMTEVYEHECKCQNGMTLLNVLVFNTTKQAGLAL